ncbi:hypothetical protein IscW_ISCW023690 [Ixodes scapularis]|uniref:Uncharacterized protein n=1 Tax=Ixodes scapularis TaxID=6945 RepID=B7QGW9_IXOSC|nr:hypothetical protein IscW_ISCW023690 [Ixodes scapularis]|eukprot:XP_002414426.1 hypothetical protein IscW_ISCW023690 [Ixodes scapularis]
MRPGRTQTPANWKNRRRPRSCHRLIALRTILHWRCTSTMAARLKSLLRCLMVGVTMNHQSSSKRMKSSSMTWFTPTLKAGASQTTHIMETARKVAAPKTARISSSPMLLLLPQAPSLKKHASRNL